MGSDVKDKDLDEEYKKLISFIESEYECSGMCSPSLFYLTQSVKEGPPKRGCLAPFMGDLTSFVGRLGEALLASGIFFLLMIFCIIPMCCFQPGENNSVMAYGKEGGEMEMEDKQAEDKQENKVAPETSID